jgi:hypothetical protein
VTRTIPLSPRFHLLRGGNVSAPPITSTAPTAARVSAWRTSPALHNQGPAGLRLGLSAGVHARRQQQLQQQPLEMGSVFDLGPPTSPVARQRRRPRPSGLHQFHQPAAFGGNAPNVSAQLTASNVSKPPPAPARSRYHVPSEKMKSYRTAVRLLELRAQSIHRCLVPAPRSPTLLG